MESVKDLLSDPLKGKNHAQGVLCFLFREVLLWRRVNTIVWNKRLSAFFEKPHNQEKPDKGNLNKALLNDDLPWAGFKKAIDFLSPLEAKLHMAFTWSDGRTVEYEIVVDPAANEKTHYADILTSNTNQVFASAKKPVGTLAYLYRHIADQEGIDPEKWEQLFQEYADNPINNYGVKKTELNSNVSQLRKGLLETKLSWNQFRRGILLFKPQKEVYTLKLKWTNDPNLLKSMPDDSFSAEIVNKYTGVDV